MIRQTVLEFKIESTAEELTAHGGLALLAEYNHGLGLRQLSDRYLPAPGSNRGYAPSVFVESLTLLLQAGGQSLEDLRELGQESALMSLVGQELIPDPDKVGDWLRRMGDPQQAGLHGLGQIRDLLNQRMLRRDGIGEYTLDADADRRGKAASRVDLPRRQRVYAPAGLSLRDSGLSFGGISGGECGSPGRTADVLSGVPAKDAPRQAHCLLSGRADQRLGSRWSDLGPHRRSGSGGEAIRTISEGEEPTVGCGYEVAETVHPMAHTHHAFRLIVKRERRRQPDLFAEDPYFYHAVATHWPLEQKSTAEVLTWHNQRGQAENFLKELKGGFGLDRMPCGQGEAHAVFFRLGVIAYNLFLGFKRLCSPQAFWHHTIATFRWKLIQVAGRIVHHAGQVILRLALEAEKLRLFRSIRKRCWELAVT